MLFAIIGRDGPNSVDLRNRVRPSHLEYVKNSPGVVKMGGALLSPDGASMVGSVIIIERDDLAAAQVWSANDPYRTQGVFTSVEIHPYRLAVAHLPETGH